MNRKVSVAALLAAALLPGVVREELSAYLAAQMKKMRSAVIASRAQADR